MLAQAFKGLLASDRGMLGILLGASPAMCLGVWQMIHTPKHIAGEAPNNIPSIPPLEAKSPLNACLCP